MREKQYLAIKDILVFLMVCVYFTLNAKYITFSGLTIVRWLLPISLVLVTILFSGGTIVRPPILVCFFLIAVFPSIWLSIDISTSILKMAAFLIILYGNYIFFMGSKGTEEMEKYFYIFSVIVTFFQLLNLFYIGMGIGYDGGRATGITTNANTLGIYSNIAFWASVYLTGKARRMISKIFFLMLVLSSIYTAIASGSRSALIVIGLNIIFWGFIKYRNLSLIHI